ncbi:hypothetical protein EV121DRAFT_281344 [Schizophyllum commune]
MQRRAPQARGDGSASSALRWALHHHVASAPCSTLETDARPEIRLRKPTPPGAPSPTTLAPPPIDAAPHLRRCPHRAKDARAHCQRFPEVLSDCAACALPTLRALMIFCFPGLYQYGGLKIGVTQLTFAPAKAEFAIAHRYLRGLLERTKVVLFVNVTVVQYCPRFLLNGQRRHHFSRCRNLS